MLKPQMEVSIILYTALSITWATDCITAVRAQGIVIMAGLQKQDTGPLESALKRIVT